MKKTILILAAIAIAICATASAATYEQVAIQAAKDAGCVSQSDNPYLDAYTEVTSICFVSGSIHTTHIYYNPVAKCNETPNKPCPKPAVYLKADVTFDCNNTVSSVVCY